MRAGLCVGGVTVMILGALCVLTIILLPLGLLIGLVGFVMLIVGIFTSGHKHEHIHQPIQLTQQVTSSTPHAIPTTSYATPEVLVICPECKARISTKSKFCPECGAEIEDSNAREVLLICPKCKARIPAKSKFCPECGTNLEPKRKNKAR